MTELEHDRLDVYRTAIEFLGLADTVSGSLPKRAGVSCRSVAALLGIAAMLTAMVLRLDQSGSRSRSGSRSG
jgi:hypothetical protein